MEDGVDGGTEELWVLPSPFLEPCPSTFRPINSISLLLFFSVSHPTIIYWSNTTRLSPLKVTCVCMCASIRVCLRALLICSSRDTVGPVQVRACPMVYIRLYCSLLMVTCCHCLSLHTEVGWYRSTSTTVVSRGFQTPGMIRWWDEWINLFLVTVFKRSSTMASLL